MNRILGLCAGMSSVEGLFVVLIEFLFNLKSIIVLFVLKQFVSTVESTDFCQRFVENKNKIDFSFEFDFESTYLTIGYDFWELKVSNKILEFISKDSQKSKALGRQWTMGYTSESYYFAFKTFLFSVRLV